MSSVSTAEQRREALYKKGIDAAAGSRRREETSVKIRKQKKLEQLKKRRNLRCAAGDKGASPNSASSSVHDNSAAAAAATSAGLSATLAGLPALANAIKTGPAALQFQAVRMVRKLLSKEHDPPVQEVLDQGIVPALVQFLSRTDTMFEAAWALTNIASTEHTHVVVDAGACPHLVNLLRAPAAEVREQAAWCLGNIAGDNAKYRDALLTQTHMLHNVLLNIKTPANPSLLRNVTWSLSNLCRGKPKPALKAIAPAFPALRHLLTIADEEVVTDACWALSYVSDGEDARIEGVVDSGAVPLLINLMGSTQKATIMTPALRTVGNIVSGNDKCTQHALDNKLLHVLSTLINHRKKAIRKETCWALSNITAGTHAQIKAVADFPGLLANVIAHTRTGSEWDVRKEAAWAVSNMVNSANAEVVCKVVDAGFLPPLIDLLEVADSKIIMVALEAVEAVLKTGRKCGRDFTETFEAEDGIDKLEALQEHKDQKIYERTLKIIETYFAEEDEEDENQAAGSGPAHGGPMTFDFTGAATTMPNAPQAQAPGNAFNFGIGCGAEQRAPPPAAKMAFDFSSAANMAAF
jgi:importin subunit alpha-6/7